MTALTQAEWDEALRYFPGLNGHRNECLKTGEATPAPGPPYYNCIAWSLGTTTEWIDPPTTQTAFIELCKFRRDRYLQRMSVLILNKMRGEALRSATAMMP